MAKFQENKLKYIFVELSHHLPFSIFGVAISIFFMAILTFLTIIAKAQDMLPEASIELFHVFHPVHILFSAVATTAMFWKHEKRLIKAMVVGFLGSVGICGISDIFFPFLGGQLFGMDMHFHVCIIENPELVYPFAVVGVLAGLMVTEGFERSTQYSHSVHVFVSSMASLLYLIGFGLHDWIDAIGKVFIITIFAVMLPCCASDIAFPIFCAHKNCKHD